MGVSEKGDGDDGDWASGKTDTAPIRRGGGAKLLGELRANAAAPRGGACDGAVRLADSRVAGPFLQRPCESAWRAHYAVDYCPGVSGVCPTTETLASGEFLYKSWEFR